jgi:hypothetical protein
MTEQARRSSRDASVVAGFLMIGLGVLILAGRAEIGDIGDLFRLYWPMILVVIGLPKLRRRETAGSGLWLMALGGWMQVAHLGLFGLTWRSSWPILLIALGAVIVVKAFLEAGLPAGKMAAEGDERDS